jgi:hypothetical protein
MNQQPNESPTSPRGKFRRQLQALDDVQLINADPQADGTAEKQPWRLVVWQEVCEARTA